MVLLSITTHTCVLVETLENLSLDYALLSRGLADLSNYMYST